MKLLFVTSIKEDQQTVAAIFVKAGIEVFSITETVGVKNKQSFDLMDAWFSSGSEKADALILFSFTAQDKAFQAIELIKTHNEATASAFPIRAFIMPVEQSTYSI